MPGSRIRLFIALFLVAAAACESGAVSGRYVDYETGKPIAGAVVRVTQRGWGLSDGQLVWDKSDTTTGYTNGDGAFSIADAGSIHVEAPGYQVLTGIAPGKQLLIQGKQLRAGPHPTPGGLLKLGHTQGGKPFGWSFAANRVALHPEEADLFPVAVSLTPNPRLALRAPAPSFLFVSAAEQHLAARSYGALLRYLDRPPSRPFTDAVTLTEACTLFVRTRDQRFAKVAFDPRELSTGNRGPLGGGLQAGPHFILPFAYQPFPTDDLYYDPAGSHGAVQPELAAAAAQLPSNGPPVAGPRTYRLSVATPEGRELERVDVRLMPEQAQRVSQSSGKPLLYRFDNITLSYRPDGIAGVRLSIQGNSFVHHLAEILPNKRFDVEREFHDYSSGRARPLFLRLRELD